MGAVSVDPSEVAKFSAIASEWWDENGKFGVLHKFNPIRIDYIQTQTCAHFSRKANTDKPLTGLRILDIGCGGGLLSEPLAALGAVMTSIDPSQKNIKTAMVHAEQNGVKIDYRVSTAEELVEAGELFDVVLNMEVIEHVSDPHRFMATCSSLVKPGGLMFNATINRTLKAFGLAILGAEYILKWMPKDTHHWEKFITPQEMAEWLKDAGMLSDAPVGVVFNPLNSSWRRSGDCDVNYMLLATKSDKA